MKNQTYNPCGEIALTERYWVLPEWQIALMLSFRMITPEEAPQVLKEMREEYNKNKDKPCA